MSRHRKTKPEEAIQAAQTLFWKHGYCGLGTRQIEEETGLTRFTLQTSYGGKKALYLQTLDAYLETFETAFLPRMLAGGQGEDLEGVASWFEARADPSLMGEAGVYGCLMLNAIIEFQGQDEEINQRSTRYFSALRNHFKKALEAARSNGTFDPQSDIGAKVEILMGLALSLNVVIRAAADNAAGQTIAKATASMIRDWATDPSA
jgi:TetR/AcrR family transcriptional repressor of nem operon